MSNRQSPLAHGARFAALAVLFAALSRLAISIVPTTVGWDQLVPAAVSGRLSFLQLSTSDPQDNAYFVTTAYTSSYEYWSLYKVGPYGSVLWKQNFANTPGASPSALAVDDALNVYLLGTERNAQGFSEARIYKVSPAGALIYSKAELSYLKLETITVLSAKADAQNRLHVAYSIPNSSNIENLFVQTYDPTFAPVSNFSDKNLHPFSAAFDANLNVFVSGLPLSGSDGSWQYDAYNSAGARQWQMTEVGSPNVSHLGKIALAGAPGAAVIADNEEDASSGGATFTFTVYQVNLTGQILWSSAAQQGEVTGLAQTSSGSTFFTASVLTQGTQTPYLGCISPTGAINFFSVSNAQLLGSGRAGMYAKFYDDATKQLGVASVGPSGQVNWRDFPSGLGAGVAPQQAVALSNGVAVLGPTLAVGGKSDTWIEREVEGVALKSVSTINLTGGNHGYATVTLNEPAPSSVRVSLTLTGATSASITIPASVTVPAGATSAKFLASSSVVGADQTGYVFARCDGAVCHAYAFDLAARLSGVTLNSSSVNGGNPVSGTVSLTGLTASGGTAITVTSEHPAVIGAQTVTVSGNSKSATFSLPTTPPSSSMPVKLTFKDALASRKPSRSRSRSEQFRERVKRDCPFIAPSPRVIRHPITRSPAIKAGLQIIYPGDVLIFRTLAGQVHPPLRGLTAVFGMGTGVSLSP